MKRQRRVFPPVFFLASILLMVGLRYLDFQNSVLMTRVIYPPVSYAGLVFIIAGVVLAGFAAGLFGKEHTTIKPFEESSSLVTAGPFRFTRNPMYLGMVLVLIGVGILLGRFLPFLVIPAFAVLIQQRFIRHEESDLHRVFGSEYEEFQARVRRWL